jgi:O-antigen ligase/polysaccharide polymerase Wzy-like membrane protein
MRVLPPIVVALLGGYLASKRPGLAVVCAIGAIVTGLVVLGIHHRVVSTPRPFRWVPAAWVTLLFVSNIQSQLRDALAVTSGTIGGDNLLEIGAYAVIAFGTARLWLDQRGERSQLASWPVVAWTLFALASTFWSNVPLFTFARAAQLVIVACFAVQCVRLTERRPDLRRAIVMDTLRAFVVITAILAIWGLVDRSFWLEGRYMWPTGAHPIAVGMVVGAALLVLLFGGRLFPGMPRVFRGILVLLMVAVMLLGHNRSVLVAVCAGVAAGLWAMPGRRRLAARLIAIPFFVGGAAILAMVAAGAFITYFERGQSESLLFSLTGRTELWRGAIERIDSTAGWAFGAGYGSPRVILITVFGWGGQAHSAFIELLLGVGVVGTTLALIAIATIGRRTLSVRQTPNHVIGGLEPAIFTYLIVMGFVEAALVTPGFAFALFMLLFLDVSGTDRPRGSPESPRLERDVWSGQGGSSPRASPRATRTAVVVQGSPLRD